MADAVTQAPAAALAAAIAGGDPVALEPLFLAAKARPPLLVWQPNAAMLRSPVLARLLQQWQALRPASDRPPHPATAAKLLQGSAADWTMQLVPPDAELAGNPPLERFVYRHYGAGIARHYGRDMTGESIAAFTGHIGTFFAAVYEAVRLRPEPVFTEHEPPAAVLVRSWRRLILPFAVPGEPVSSFVVGNIPESAVGTLLDVMHDAALVTDGDGRIRLANRAANALLGPAAKSLMGTRLDEHLPGLTAVMQRLAEEVDGVGTLGRHELELVTGRRRTALEVSIGGTRVAGQPLFVLVVRDVTERRDREQELQTIAFEDELTRVLNRRGLFEKVPQADRRKTRRSPAGFGLILVDLDGFKSLNDGHGHALGDAVLSAVAARLTANLRGEDAVARWGGDEFVVVLPRIGDRVDLEAAARKLQQVLAPPFTIGAATHAVGVSIGAARYPAHGRDFDEVLAAADRALYAAKANGGGEVQLAPD